MTIKQKLISIKLAACGNAETMSEQNTAQETLRKIIELLEKGFNLDDDWEFSQKK